MNPSRPTTHPVETTVDSNGVRIAVRGHSPAAPDRPTVVLVHGYPDRQQMWDLVVERLPLDRFHVVTYDVRGAGASDAPDQLREYVTDRLVDDLAAVIDAVEPEGRTGPAVHLVGHDWGSVQLWDAVGVAERHPGLRGRIASFTSISGSALDCTAMIRIGDSDGLTFQKVGALGRLRGNWPDAALIARCTSPAAASMSRSSSNCMVICV